MRLEVQLHLVLAMAQPARGGGAAAPSAARAPRAAQVGQPGALDGGARAGHAQVRARARVHVLLPLRRAVRPHQHALLSRVRRRRGGARARRTSAARCPGRRHAVHWDHAHAPLPAAAQKESSSTSVSRRACSKKIARDKGVLLRGRCRVAVARRR